MQQAADGEFATWSEQVWAHLRVEPERPALISLTEHGVETHSRSDFRKLVAGAASLLRQTGADQGAALPGLFVIRPNAVATLVAGSLTGHPIAPLGPRMTPRELLACLDNIEGDVLLTEPEWFDLASEVGSACGKKVVVVEPTYADDEDLKFSVALDDTAMFIHTSGTTGVPKRITVRQDALLQRARVHGGLIGLRPLDRFITGGLFHHMAGLGNVSSALGNGATLLSFPAFSVDAWRAVEELGPTHYVTIPSIMEMLLAADAMNLPSLRVIAYGGSPIHPETMRRVQDVVPDAEFVNLFGQSEGSPITVLSAEDHREAASHRPELLQSVGRPAPGVELHLHEPGPDGVGEVWARMSHSFFHDEEGWQHTGDLGRIDDDGYLYLVGRKGDMIIRGGENVFPLEVEQVLETHPAIMEAGVIGKPDQRLGETILAYVVLVDDAGEFDAEDVRRFARERLAGFKVPQDWRVVDELPRNSGGKLLRKRLVETLAATS